MSVQWQRHKERKVALMSNDANDHVAVGNLFQLSRVFGLGILADAQEDELISYNIDTQEELNPDEMTLLLLAIPPDFFEIWRGFSSERFESATEEEALELLGAPITPRFLEGFGGLR